MEYVVWGRKNEGNSCMLLPIQGVERDWELLKGVPRGADFPSTAAMRMSDRNPRDIALSDCLMNQSALIVVHKKIQDFLAKCSLRNVEFLPVAVINHKDRLASSDYVIVHVLEPQDCLDPVASEAEFSGIIPTDVTHVEQLVIDADRVDPNLRLFRIKGFGYPMIVERTLANELRDAGFTGVAFVELSRYEQ